MVPSRRMEIAESLVAEFRKRHGQRLVGMGVYGSVGRGEDRPGSDIDMLVVTREGPSRDPMRTVEHPESRIIEGIPVTFLRWTVQEARDEVTGTRKDLNVALAGWRSLRPLYDPEGVLATLRRRAFHPTATQWREAARRALFETFEDLGKLRNAVEVRDIDEVREMGIWYSEGAMGSLFDLEQFVLTTGRRAFIEALRFGDTGKAIRRLRYGTVSPDVAGQLAEKVWSGLLRRARRQGIRLPPLLSAGPDVDLPKTSRRSVAQRFVARILARERGNLVAAGLYGSVSTGEDRRHSDIDLTVVLRQPKKYDRMTVFEGRLMSVGETTVEELQRESAISPWNLPEALSGWRSMRILYDPSGVLRRAVVQSRRSSNRGFHQAALKNLLEGYECLGKLEKAARAKDRNEA